MERKSERGGVEREREGALERERGWREMFVQVLHYVDISSIMEIFIGVYS